MLNTRVPLRFGCGISLGTARGMVIAQAGGRSPTESADRYLMEWSRDSGWRSRDITLTARAMTFADREERDLVVMGEGGYALVLSESGMVEEMVDPSIEGPLGRGNIRNVRLIGSHLYAVGMGRQVYRREGPLRWTHFDRDTVQPLGSLDMTGFSAIDGLTESDLFAVGLLGEIWHCHGERWRPIDSPTNVILQCVRVIEPDLMYANGQQGILLRGSRQGWQSIEHFATRDDLWGMEWFDDHLYVASNKAIYRLDGEDLEMVNTGLGDSFTYGELHAGKGALWSFGARHVAKTHGDGWVDVTPSAP